MGTNEFDRIFSDKLHSHPSEVDTAALWSAVEKGLPAGARYGAWWVWLSGFLLLIALSSLAFYEVHQQENRAELRRESLIKSTDSDALQPFHSDSNASGEAARNSSGTLSVSEAIPPTGGDDSKNAQAAPDNGGDALQARADGLVENEAASPLMAQAWDDAKERAATEHATDSEARVSEVESGRPQGADSSQRAFAKNDEQESGKSGAEQENAQQDIEGMALGSFVLADGDEESSSGLAKAGISWTSEVSGTSGPESSALQLLPKILPAASPRSAELAAVPDRVDYGLANAGREFKKWGLRIDLGAGIAGRQLHALHSDMQDYARQRNESEHGLEYLQAQMGFQYYFHTNWYIMSGVHLTRINEHFQAEHSYEELREVEHLSGMHVESSGDTTMLYSTSAETHRIHTSHSVYNSYTWLDIPIFLGYEQRLGAWTLGAEVGAYYNLRMRTGGYILHPSERVVPIAESGMYRSDIGMSFGAGLRLGYVLSDRSSIVLTPWLRHLPGDLLDTDLMEHSYTLYGLQFGWLMRF